MRLRVSHGIGLALLLTSGAVAWRALSAEPPRAVPPPPAAAAPPASGPTLEELLRAEGELGEDVAMESPDALAHFHDALARAEAGEGQARVLVYGGSHTAGDLYVGRMREALQARFGDAGHGFLPLVPWVDNHWAWGMRVDEAEGWGIETVGFKHRDVARYGLAGAAYETDEAGAFAAVEADTWGNGRQASRVEVLYDRQPGGGALEVWIDGRLVETLDTASDPPEAGRAVYDVSDATHRLEVRAVGDGPVTVYGAVMERAAPGVLVENLGLVGSKARHQLLWDAELWRALFVTRRPDLVALAYGNNETTDTHLSIAEHEAHLRAVMTRITEAAPEASCLLLGPTDRPRVTEDGELAAREVVGALTAMQRRVAEAFGCAFFDTLAFQGGLGGGIAWLGHDPPYMRSDRQHLSREGYLRWGEVLTRALLDGYEP
ncbi:MAG: GDSL-type esterase/lipase family protein [Sandaracinaceae bacterium]